MQRLSQRTKSDGDMSVLGYQSERKVWFGILVCFMLAVALSVSLVGLWIYNTSASTFALQHNIQIAQITRDRIVRGNLANRSDVQAFAATQSTFFRDRYYRHARAMRKYSADLERELRLIDSHYDPAPIRAEDAIFARWQRTVAAPIFAGGRPPVKELLTGTDLELAHEFLTEDAKIQDFLAHAESAQIDRREALLQDMVWARAFFVMAGILVIGLLLWSRERAKRRRFLQDLEADEQRRIAELFQTSLAPNALPENVAAQLEAVYFPATASDAVGGDWYEVIELGADRVLLVIGDVAGHGLDAAIAMNVARQTIVTAAIIETDPARLLARANNILTARNSRFVTALCGILNTKTGDFHYAAAGHPPPLVVPPSGPARMLEYGGPPLGAFADLVFASRSFVLESGTSVILFTDGLLENDRNVVGGEERLLITATQVRDCENVALALYERIIDGGVQKDDIAILRFQW